MLWATDEFVRATMKIREEEARRARLISQARQPLAQGENGRTWRWRIEPGMEDAFRNLIGWLLSSQRDAEVETASTAPVERASAAPVETASAAPGGDSVWDPLSARLLRSTILGCSKGSGRRARVGEERRTGPLSCRC